VYKKFTLSMLFVLGLTLNAMDFLEAPFVGRPFPRVNSEKQVAIVEELLETLSEWTNIEEGFQGHRSSPQLEGKRGEKRKNPDDDREGIAHGWSPDKMRKLRISTRDFLKINPQENVVEAMETEQDWAQEEVDVASGPALGQDEPDEQIFSFGDDTAGI